MVVCLWETAKEQSFSCRRPPRQYCCPETSIAKPETREKATYSFFYTLPDLEYILCLCVFTHLWLPRVMSSYWSVDWKLATYLTPVWTPLILSTGEETEDGVSNHPHALHSSLSGWAVAETCLGNSVFHFWKTVERVMSKESCVPGKELITAF